MRALAIYAGREARLHLQRQGLHSADVRVVAGAAGGPKGLVLGPLDRFIFGHWLAQSTARVDLVGASFGACRMATACLPEVSGAFVRFEQDYIAQHYALADGERRPSASRVTAQFAALLEAWFGAQRQAIVRHQKFRLHVLTARGKGWLAGGSLWHTRLGFAKAYLDNLRQRKLLAQSLERVVFSGAAHAGLSELPFDGSDFPTSQLPLDTENLLAALLASCSVPFALAGVTGIAGAPPGTYWDGGLTDYHMHLRFRGLVLYPHFQATLVPGWLDKHLRWRHRPSSALDHVVLLAPRADWVARLPDGRLPDRQDFARYAHDPATRMRRWRQAASASAELADEWAQWLQRPDPAQVEAL